MDTIAAIATPPGEGGIGIIRLSGKRSVMIASAVFTPVSGQLKDLPQRFLTRGQLHDVAGRLLDNALAVVMHAPQTFTGENVVELHCHGSPVLLQEVLSSLFSHGARLARPGEFTQRAFLNGRLDLMQAEAVIDLITAPTTDAVRNAAGQTDGLLTRKLNALTRTLIETCAHFHAVIDYPDDAVEDLQDEKIYRAVRRAAEGLEQLAATYERGRLVRDGIPAAVIGRPNTGKSSLLNALLGYNRAIVSPQPGTTRDTVTESLRLGGVLIRIADTAGLRHTADEIEAEGVTRARNEAQQASLLFVVLDGSEPLTEEDRMVMDLARGKNAVVLINKSDLPQKIDRSMIEAAFLHVLSVSAVHGGGLERLDALVRRLWQSGMPPCDGQILTNARHADAVTRAAFSLREAQSALSAGLTPDVVVSELELALAALGELTGKTVKDEVAAAIFERFCVGK
jgi:tRNA modification GTPase